MMIKELLHPVSVHLKLCIQIAKWKKRNKPYICNNRKG